MGGDDSKMESVGGSIEGERSYKAVSRKAERRRLGPGREAEGPSDQEK